MSAVETQNIEVVTSEVAAASNDENAKKQKKPKPNNKKLRQGEWPVNCTCIAHTSCMCCVYVSK